MSKVGRYIRVINKNSLQQNVLLLKVFFDIVYVKMLVTFFPLRTYSKWFHGSMSFDPKKMQPFHYEFLLINRLMSLVPLKKTCLLEAMTFHKYFRRYKILIPIFVGVNTEGPLKAHAWMFFEKHHGFSTVEV